MSLGVLEWLQGHRVLRRQRSEVRDSFGLLIAASVREANGGRIAGAASFTPDDWRDYRVKSGRHVPGWERAGLVCWDGVDLVIPDYPHRAEASIVALRERQSYASKRRWMHAQRDPLGRAIRRRTDGSHCVNSAENREKRPPMAMPTIRDRSPEPDLPLSGSPPPPSAQHVTPSLPTTAPDADGHSADPSAAGDRAGWERRMPALACLIWALMAERKRAHPTAAKCFLEVWQEQASELEADPEAVSNAYRRVYDVTMRRNRGQKDPESYLPNPGDFLRGYIGGKYRPPAYTDRKDGEGTRTGDPSRAGLPARTAPPDAHVRPGASERNPLGRGQEERKRSDRTDAEPEPWPDPPPFERSEPWRREEMPPIPRAPWCRL